MSEFERQPVEEIEQITDAKADELAKYTSQLEKVNAFIEKVSSEPATRRNFDLIATPDTDRPEQFHLTIAGHDGERFDVQHLLPEGYTFVESDHAFCDRKKQEVGINLERIGTRGDLITLLHEIGHAVNSPDIERTTDQLHHEIFGNRKKIKPNASMEILFRELDEMLKRKLRVLTFEEDISTISERSAWAYALEVSRILAKSGYDIFADFDSTSEVRDYINACLTSYEIRRQAVYRENGNRPFLREGKFTRIQDQAEQSGHEHQEVV